MLITRLKFSSSPILASRLGLALLRAWFSNVSLVGVLLVTLMATQTAQSQDIGKPSEAEVSALLAEIEAKNERQAENKFRSIYHVTSGQKITEIKFDSEFKIIRNIGKWSIVEFNQQVVPGWVSSDYVIKRNGRIVVNAKRLNMRQAPSLDSAVMLQLTRGYDSKINDQKNGFVKVLAPKSYRVAIFSGSDAQAKQDRSLSQNRSEVRSALQRKPQTKLAASKSLSPIDQATLDPSSNELKVTGTSTSSERLHVIAPGDAVSLLVFGETDLSIENVRVPQSGRVSFPLIGSVLVAGRTIPQVEESVAELLAQGYVKNPQLSVTMFSYRPVFIRGAVQQTGSFPFSEGLTVGKLIALAGGSKKSAKQNGVSILREGNVIESTLSIESLIEVQSGDVISIDEELGVQESDATYIYLHGEVASPGEYEFRRGLTVEKAIVLAGGFTLRGSRKKISVTRYVDVASDQEPEKLKKVKLFTPIKPGDVINVGATWF